jgi:hypothetical protein
MSIAVQENQPRPIRIIKPSLPFSVEAKQIPGLRKIARLTPRTKVYSSERSSVEIKSELSSPSSAVTNTKEPLDSIFTKELKRREVTYSGDVREVLNGDSKETIIFDNRSP